jgi:competence protein ComFC
LKFRPVMLPQVLYEVASTLMDFIYPSLPRCTLCGYPFYQNVTVQICEKCLKKFNFVTGTVCTVCGRPLLSNSSKICHDCFRVKRYFQCGRGIGIYNGQLREYILDLKYRGRWDLAKPLGELMGEFLRIHCELFPIDFVVPVPLYPGRFAERGYNQAELLAKYLCKKAKLEMMSANLVRTRATIPQKGLNIQERINNMCGAFSLLAPGKVQGKSVLLVDDIFTTGSTVNECSRVFLLAGAGRVGVLSLGISV